VWCFAKDAAAFAVDDDDSLVVHVYYDVPDDFAFEEGTGNVEIPWVAKES